MTLPLQQYRERATLPDVVLRMAGTSVAVRTNLLSLQVAVSRYFRPLLGDSAADLSVIAIHGTPEVEMDRLVDLPVKPGRTVKEAVYEDDDGRVVFKRRTGVAMVVRPPEFMIIGDLERHLNQVHNLIGHVLARAFMGAGYGMLHASAVTLADRGIAFGARSGGGKSTAALAVLERGGRFVSNDRLFVRTDGPAVQMLGMPKWPRVNPGTLLRLPSLTGMLSPAEQQALNALPPQELWELEQKHDVDVDRIFGPGTGLFTATPLHALYLLDWSLQGEGLDVAPVDATERMAELVPLVKRLGPYGSSPAIEAAAQEALENVATHLPMFVVRGKAEPLRLAELLLAQPALP